MYGRTIARAGMIAAIGVAGCASQVSEPGLETQAKQSQPDGNYTLIMTCKGKTPESLRNHNYQFFTTRVELDETNKKIRAKMFSYIDIINGTALNGRGLYDVTFAYGSKVTEGTNFMFNDLEFDSQKISLAIEADNASIKKTVVQIDTSTKVRPNRVDINKSSASLWLDDAVTPVWTHSGCTRQKS